MGQVADSVARESGHCYSSVDENGFNSTGNISSGPAGVEPGAGRSTEPEPESLYIIPEDPETLSARAFEGEEENYDSLGFDGRVRAIYTVGNGRKGGVYNHVVHQE